jgi:SAM-dependent methyltransferase
MSNAADEAQAYWRDQLAGWAIPERITAAVADSPWRLATGTFARRAQSQIANASGFSYETAFAALDPPGSVLDVGAGAGAASLPLAPRTTELTAVDANEAMLASLTELAQPLGLPVRTAVGSWPRVASTVPVADVVVCHHVLYNVPDLADFALALHGHARRRVVVELTARHPLGALNPLWRVMHDLDRPDGPTAEDAVAVLRSVDLAPAARYWARPPRPEYPSFAELLSVTRQRLCLPPEREGELESALLDLGVDPTHPRDLPPPDDRVATLWWDK